MAITHQQQSIIIKSHSEGHLDRAIAHLAGVSVSTVRRYRKRLGLPTKCTTTKRGKIGERHTLEVATLRGLKAEMREGHNASFDLYVSDRRLDAKTSMQLANGKWRFRLPTRRRSYYGQYEYTKDYASDCDVVVLVALYPDGRTPDFYMLDSRTLPTSVTIRPGGPYAALKNDWHLLEKEETLAA